MSEENVAQRAEKVLAEAQYELGRLRQFLDEHKGDGSELTNAWAIRLVTRTIMTAISMMIAVLMMPSPSKLLAEMTLGDMLWVGVSLLVFWRSWHAFRSKDDNGRWP